RARHAEAALSAAQMEAHTARILSALDEQRESLRGLGLPGTDRRGQRAHDEPPTSEILNAVQSQGVRLAAMPEAQAAGLDQDFSAQKAAPARALQTSLAAQPAPFAGDMRAAHVAQAREQADVTLREIELLHEQTRLVGRQVELLGRRLDEARQP